MIWDLMAGPDFDATKQSRPCKISQIKASQVLLSINFKSVTSMRELGLRLSITKNRTMISCILALSNALQDYNSVFHSARQLTKPACDFAHGQESLLK